MNGNGNYTLIYLLFSWQMEVLGFSLEAAWLRLMEGIYCPSILQKGGDEVIYVFIYLCVRFFMNFMCSFMSTEVERRSSSVNSDYFVQANTTISDSLTGRLIFTDFDFLLIHTFRQTPPVSNTQVTATCTSYCRF